MIAATARLDKCNPNHRGPTQLDVVVYQKAGLAPAVPDTIIVESPEQTIVWTPVGGELHNLTFDDVQIVPKRGADGNYTVRIPEGLKGQHKYSYDFWPDGDVRRTIQMDPMADVEY